MPTAQATQAPLALLEGPQTFQLFPDNNTVRGYAQIIHGTLEEHRAKLEQLNAEGMGVFFTVNQTDGQGRKAENITAVRAYICDIDNIPDPKDKLNKMLELIRSKAPPSAIVESKNGLHCYWYAVDGESIDQREYATVNEHLIKRFTGCTQSKDLARVLRIPAFMHRKEMDNPFLVKRVIEDQTRRYTADQIKTTFPIPVEEPKRYSLDMRKNERPDNDEDLTEDQCEFRWRRTLEGLTAWTPVDGMKHTVLLLAFGVARKYQIPQSRAESDLFPIVATWNTKDSTEQSILKHANWSYSDGADIAHINGLRRVGVEIDLKGDPGAKNWRRKRR